jgi:1-deoxy-D-xylulose-5-phosphate synthase
MVIMTPSDENECRKMLTTGYQYIGPAAVRYPRGTGPGAAIENALTALPIGKAELKRQGKQVAILAFGSMLAESMRAAETLNATVVNMRFVKPLDISMIETMAKQHQLIVTIEENAVMGGAGAAVMEALQALSIQSPILCLGLPDKFIEHGVHETMLSECGLNAEAMIETIRKKLSVLNT